MLMDAATPTNAHRGRSIAYEGGYRFRRSAFVRGFMELADMADGEAVVAVVSALWPSLCLPSTPASPPPAATASASMSARSMRDIAGVSASNPPRLRREGLRGCCGRRRPLKVEWKKT